MSAKPTLGRRLAAEAIGTALLLAGVVGSGIMAEDLAAGNEGLALLANALATGAVLVAIILAFGAVSGAHFNPAVTAVEASRGALPWRDVPAYAAAQLGGAFAGVGAANAMFGKPLFFASKHVRTGAPLWLGEMIATFGLVVVIQGCARRRPEAVPFAVGAYITGAYWFTSSTSFANPAVTLARCATNTFTGIRPVDAWAFIAAQALGAIAAAAVCQFLFPPGAAPGAAAERSGA